MSIKVVIFYNQFSAGFSETWYLAGSSPVIDTSQTLWKNFLKASIGCRATGTVITAIRFSTVEPPKRSFLVRLFGEYVAPVREGFAEITPDVVSTTGVFTVTSGTSRKRIFMRGLPDEYVQRTNTGQDEMINAALQATNRYFATAQRLGLSIRQQVPAGGGGPVSYPVLSVRPDPANNHWSILTSNTQVLLAPGPQMFLRFNGIPFDDLPGFPRLATLVHTTAVAPFEATVPYRFRNQETVTPSKMRFCQNVWEVQPTVEFVFDRWSERKTGRPFGVLRGRSRGLVRAQ